MDAQLPPMQGAEGGNEGDTGSSSRIPETSGNKKSAERNSSGVGGDASSKIRRRNRKITSCMGCRGRKLKCDRLHPCSNCSKSRRNCVFLAPATDHTSRMKRAELKEKMGHLERGLESDVTTNRPEEHRDASDNARTGTDDRMSRDVVSGGHERTSEEQIPFPDDEKGLRPTELAVQDAAYEDEADDDMYDLGFKMGKMRLTDRIGGLFRPRLADELSEAIGGLHVTDKKDEPGPESSTKPPRLRELLPDSCLDPGSSHIAPRSDLVFGNSWQPYNLVNFLPSRVAANRLLEQFWESVHPIAKVVHRPTFEKQYGEFWLDISRGLEPAYSLQALVFAVLFAASMSMSEHVTLGTFGIPHKKLIENFQLATEMALGKANFLRSTKTRTLQAFVMYMIPMCRSEVSRAHSALIGAGIRLAECISLHRDPEEYGIGPVETHVRRILWYQLCFLDIRTSEAQGPRQFIRRDGFSTKFPLNVNDSDFRVSPSHDLADRREWTDMTFTLIRFECNELFQSLHLDRPRLETESVSLTHVLGKIEAFREVTYAKYGPMIHVSNPEPIQRAARLLLSMTMGQAYIKVLHPFLLSVKVRIPDRLRQVILSAGTQQLETAIELETAPDLQPWAWYADSYQQFHTALLLLVEVFLYPMRREADRIWCCLDYVFETPPSPSPSGTREIFETRREEVLAHRERKGRYLIKQTRDRLMAMREMRKLRAPVKMNRIKLSEMEGAASDDPETTGSATHAPQEHAVPGLTPVIDLIRQEESSSSPGLLPAAPAAIPSPKDPPAPQSLSNQEPSQPTNVQHRETLQQGSHQNNQDFYFHHDYSGAQQALQPNYQPHSYTSSFHAPEPITYFPDPETVGSKESGPNNLSLLPGTYGGNVGSAVPQTSAVEGEGVGPSGSIEHLLSQSSIPEDLDMFDIDWVCKSFEWENVCSSIFGE